MKKKQERIMSLLLCIVIVITMLPERAYAADMPQPLTSGASQSINQSESQSVSKIESGSSTYKSFTVSFELNGGTGTADAQQVAAGGKLDEPQGINRDGFILDGWYLEETFNTRWDFDKDTVNANITLYARWVPGKGAKDINLTAESTGSVTYVSSPEDLITALWSGGSGDIVMLNNDITLKEGMLDVYRNVTLDLNGKKLEITIDENELYGIFVNYDCTLTIKNDKNPIGGLYVTVNGWSDRKNYAAIYVLGNLIIESGYVKTIGDYLLGEHYGATGIYAMQSGSITIKGGEVEASGGYGAAGITGNVIIEGGKVTAKGGYGGAGIGGGIDEVLSYDIVIKTGRVNASGGYGAAGIGAGFRSAGGKITINGGIVTAIGDVGGAGIGNGMETTTSCDITIDIKRGTSADITATGGFGGAGIGNSSESKSSCNITINMETQDGITKKVTASGGYGAAGIGGGFKSQSSMVTIGGGVVTATGGSGAAGIGVGQDPASSCSITINGGEIYANGDLIGIGGANVTMEEW